MSAALAAPSAPVRTSGASTLTFSGVAAAAAAAAPAGVVSAVL